MKALKEKRNSLRSLLRMGLVILSVFAIAFAACGKGDDPTTPPPVDPTDPTGTTPTETTPTPVVYAKTIKILNPVGATGATTSTYPALDNVSFEGLPANLKGIEAEVLFSDNTVRIVTDAKQFTTIPYIMGADQITSDEDGQAGNFGAIGGSASTLSGNTGTAILLVAHNSNPSATAYVDIGDVIPIEKVNLVSSTAKTKSYFEDEAADFSGVIVEAEYGYRKAYKGIDGNTYEKVTKVIPLDANYVYRTYKNSGGTEFPTGLDPIDKTVNVLISPKPVDGRSFTAKDGRDPSEDLSVQWG